MVGLGEFESDSSNIAVNKLLKDKYILTESETPSGHIKDADTVVNVEDFGTDCSYKNNRYNATTIYDNDNNGNLRQLRRLNNEWRNYDWSTIVTTFTAELQQPSNEKLRLSTYNCNDYYRSSNNSNGGWSTYNCNDYDWAQRLAEAGTGEYGPTD